MLLKTLGEREVREGGRERAPSLLPAAYLTARACLSVSVRASEEKERAATAKQSEPTTRKERRKEGRKEGRRRPQSKLFEVKWRLPGFPSVRRRRIN